MKTILVALGALALGLTTACGGSGASCEDNVAKQCKKMDECDLLFGGTLAECITDGEASCDEDTCPAGQTVNTAKEKECINGINSATCDDLSMGNFPAACAEICEGGSDVDAGDPDAADFDAAQAACLANANYGAATLTSQVSQGDTESVVFEGGLNADQDLLLVQLYNGFGVFSGGIAPGTYTLSGAELNFATCGVCILLGTDFPMTGSPPPDNLYMATGGTVDVTSTSGNITGTVSNLTFEHVTVDMTSFQSTPHVDGCSSALTSAAFDTAIMAP